MANRIHRLAPTGNMDKDTDLRYVGKGDRAGDYTDARNIQRVSPDGGVQGSVIPTLGNEFAESLGSVSQQNKRYRIFLDGDATKQHAVRFLSTQRDANILVGTGPFPGQAVEFNGTVASCVAALQAAGNAGVMTFSSTATTVDITMTAYPMYQWYAESVGQDVVQVTCVAEAIPVDLAGPLKDIGSYDLLGDLFIFSTTQDNEPTEIAPDIILVGPTSGGTYIGPLTRLLFNGNHGLVQGQWIRITGSNESFLNGLFVVNSVVDATQIEIVTVTAWGVSPPVTTLGTPKVFIHPTGIGEIGVAQRDDDTDSWSYTRLLRSVELNFVSRWQVDCFFKSDFKSVFGYFTDNYNIPKRLLYSGDYETDGAMAFASGQNQLEYDTLSESITLQSPESSSKASFVGQTQGDGELYPGIKYYVIRQVDADGSSTSTSSISNPVQVTHFPDDDGFVFGREIAGGRQGDRTTVSNIIELLNLQRPELYPITQLICIESVSGSITAEVVREISTPPSGTVQIKDTGRERVAVVDVAELFYFGSDSRILKAKNIREIDQRNVLSNISTLSSVDLSLFARSIKHRLIKKEVDESTLDDVAEYQKAENINTSMGLMLNEIYRVGCRAFIKGMGWTDFFWVDDIKIDAQPVNTANPSDNRRLSGLNNYDLCLLDPQKAASIPFQQLESFARLTMDYLAADGSTQNGYTATNGSVWEAFFENRTERYEPKYKYLSPQLEFIPDWSIPIDSLGKVSSGSIISAIEFGISDNPNSVKASGIGVLCVKDNQFAPANKRNSVIANSIYEFPFVPMRYGLGGEVHNYPFDFVRSSVVGGSVVLDAVELEEKPDIVTFYSADKLIEGAGEYNPEEATSLVVLGSVESVKILHSGNPIAVFQDTNASFSVLHPSGDEYSSPPQQIGINDTIVVADTGGASSLFSNGDVFERADNVDKRATVSDLQNVAPEAVPLRNNRAPLIVFKLDSPVSKAPETSVTKQFRGIIYAQAFKDETANFKQKTLDSYFKIGQTTVLDPTPQQSIVVDGGDCVTTLFYFKNKGRIPNLDGTNIHVGPMAASTMAFVSQSRKNVKMLTAAYLPPLVTPALNDGLRLYPKNLISQTGPMTPQTERVGLEFWSPIDGVVLSSGLPFRTTLYQIQEDYDWNTVWRRFSYPHNLFLSEQSVLAKNNRPTRIWYSEKSISGERTDAYRVFLPISIKDLDLTFGEIMHHENVNGELFTLQPRKWQAQLFNTRGELQVSGNAIGAVIGDGSVLSRDGQTLSRYGTENKWSCVLGTSQGGKDVLYWFNAENGLFMRFGADGTVILSDQRRMRAFSNKAAKWVRGKDTPAFDQGIRAVWDDRNKEVIWTFTGWRDVPQWARPGIIIPSTVEGAVVTNSSAPSVTYENLPRMFRAKSTNDNLLSREPGVGADWQEFYDEIPVTDTDYYSVFTLAHNELTNGFSAFYGHIPKTYLKWRDTFLSSHPVLRNLLFEHRKGQYTTWYGKQGVEPKIEDAHIEMVLNEMPEQTMRGVAVRYLSDNVPDRVDYTTRRQRTHDTAATLTQIDDYYTGPIRNDETVTGDPDSDGQPLSGDYLRIKFTIFGGTYNLLHSMVVKIFDRLRRVNR